MRLTVLGSAASYPGPGQACTGHLIEGCGESVLLDCGPGVLSNLGRVMDPLGLNAVFISHRHPDHFLDVYGLQALLRFAPSGPVGSLPLYGPAGLFERMLCLLDQRGKAAFAEAFEFIELRANEPVTCGSLTITPMPVDHVDTTFAMRVRAEDGETTLCYTSDCRVGPGVTTAASGADVLIADATLPTMYAGRAPHMTPVETGRLASESGVRLLILGHLWPTADREQLLSDARTAFDGEILLAEELMTVELP